jgi:hypothetical protein
VAFSCFWELWLEALERGFHGDQDQARNEFTIHSMASIPEDVRDDRYILSMTDLLALTDITPPERCYPNTLLNHFYSQLAFGNTKSSMEERSRRTTTLLAIATTKRAPPQDHE